MESREAIDLDLSRYLLMVKRRWIPAVSILVSTIALSAIAASLMKPSYQADGKILFKNSSFKVAGSSLVPNGTEGGETGELKSLVATQNPIVSQMEVMTSHPLLGQVIEKLDLKDNKGKPIKVKDLQSGLSLKIAGGSDVVQVVYKSTKPQEAANIVNSIMNLYLENEIKNNRDEAEATRHYMEKQLPRTQIAVSEAESALRQFKQKNNVVDLAEESKSAVGIIGNLETAISSARAQLEDTTAQSNSLRQKLNLNPQEAIAVSAISQSPVIQANLTQLQDIERQLATERSRFSDDNPIIVNLKEKQTNLTNLLQQQIQQTIGNKTKLPQGLLRIGELKQNLIKDFLQLEVQRTGLTNRLTSLTNSRSNYERRVSVIPKLVETQHQLERKVESTQATHQALSKKIQELQLVKSKTTPNARIVSSAVVPLKPETGNKFIIIGFGFLMGGLLSTTAIALLEMRDKSLKTLKEVQSAFGYTLLGMMPSSGKKALPRKQDVPVTTLEVAVRDTPKSLTSEMSRMIQSNLRFLGVEKPLKIIVVTSAIANEGKSKVAANLASAIAQVGQNVLLIDADMRVPYQHQFWKLPLKKGLSDVLTKNSKFKVVSWRVMDNLDILTAGSKPSNPLNCLDSKQMKALIAEVSDLYDFVIIDTPPLLVAAEAVSLGRMTDGILLVSRPGVIDAQQASAAKEKLTMSNCDVLGMIVNGVIEKNESEDHFAAVQQYFTDEQETELPWTQYMTQLGETIAKSRQDTGFANPQVTAITPEK